MFLLALPIVFVSMLAVLVARSTLESVAGRYLDELTVVAWAIVIVVATTGTATLAIRWPCATPRARLRVGAQCASALAYTAGCCWFLVTWLENWVTMAM